MNRKSTQRVVLAAAAGACGLLGGCIAAPVAALGVAGNVADVGNAAFTAGTEAFSAGRLESVEFTTFEHAHAAVRSTLNDLRLPGHVTKFTKTYARYDFTDQAKSEVWIDLLERSPAICQVRVDVGKFSGSEAYARLLLKSIRARLPIVARQSATQPTSPVDLQKPREYSGFSTDNLDRP